MKMIMLLYLDGDQEVVRRLLREHDVVAWSDLAVEGHGKGKPGWYGDVPAYESRMTFTLIPDDRATALMDAVNHCSGCQHPKHPVHAFQLAVERSEDSAAPHAAGA